MDIKNTIESNYDVKNEVVYKDMDTRIDYLSQDSKNMTDGDISLVEINEENIKESELDTSVSLDDTYDMKEINLNTLNYKDVEQIDDVVNEKENKEDNKEIEEYIENKEIEEDVSNSLDQSAGGKDVFDDVELISIPVINEDLIMDYPLIDKQVVINRTKKYLKNYYSPEYTKYNKKLNDILAKLKSSKKHLLVYKNNKILITKKEEDKEVVLNKIEKPKYLFIKPELQKLKKNINIAKNILDKKYYSLKTNKNRTIEEINSFKKEKESYIELLHQKETIRLYNNVVNNIDPNEKTNIVTYQKLISDITTEKQSLDGKVYHIPDDIVTKINFIQSNQLDLYNEIIHQLRENKNVGKEMYKNKKLVEQIKSYLQNKEYQEILKDTEKIKDKTDNQIDFIVTKLPIY